jgi:hypothetical protein
MHAAIYDAVNAIDGTHESYLAFDHFLTPCHGEGNPARTK